MIATPDLTRQCQKLVRDFTPFLRQRLKENPTALPRSLWVVLMR